ncbi:TlpA disulfide reductase family protein [Pedobacter nutrimenti]|uniref:TlpA disulfide reductase family protein n=1 Tax=Pedobacter nutrimenti TaxID=1241337 RepID=UPI00293189AA|nr:TlpA disulfide reductase family protein [Pedobacter nutrimenti]
MHRKLIVVCLFIAMACNSRKSLTINGQISNCEDGKITLYLKNAISRFEETYTVEIKGGVFNFNNIKIDELKIADLIYLPNHGKEIGLNTHYFWVENDRIKISGDFREREKIQIVGNSIDKLAERYNDVWMPKRSDHHVDEGNINSPELSKALAADRYFNRILKVVKENNDSQFMLVVIYNYIKLINIYEDDKGAKRIEKLLATLNFNYNKLPISKKIISTLNLFKSVSAGNVLSVFEGHDESGKLFNSSALHNKFTLLEFWSLGCRPCIEAFPAWEEVYKKYHTKGFEMLAISLDRDRPEEWSRFLEKRNLPWKNIVEFDGEKGRASEKFFITYLPQNILIDENHRVIERNISKDRLELFLEKSL